MDLQSESSSLPPCDPQPSGKINKAAFKLFGKRKSGRTVPSIFSIGSKGEALKGPAKLPLVRSKTHDGLADTSVLEGGRKEVSASGEQLNAAGEPAVTVPHSSVSKSLSFFSLLRRGGRGMAGAEARPPRQRKGLRGLFSSMRWNRRDKSTRGAELGAVLLASRTNSVEIVKEDVALSLEPQPHVLDTIALETGEGSAKPTDQPGNAGDTGSGASTSGDQRFQESQEAAAGTCHGQEQSPASHSPAPALSPLSQESSTLSPLKATSAASRPKHSGSHEVRLLPHTPTMTVTPPEPSVSEPSTDRLCYMFTDVTSLKSFDSLTGCGDIIADTEEEGASASGSSSGTGSSSGGTGGGTRGAGVVALSTERPSPIRAPAPPPPAAATPAAPLIQAAALPSVALPPATAVLKVRAAAGKPQGSGVVAYMGGGEEMASPDEVDDADMQGLWHMLPRKGEDSPALPRADPVHHAPSRAQKRLPPVKTLGLSKIPVGGSGSRAGKHLREAPLENGRGKDLQDAPANSDEGYWDSTTPGPEEEESARFLSQDGLPRDSCSGDALYDLYVDPPEGGVASDEEMTPPASSSSSSSTSGKSKLTPPSQATSFRSLKGSTSLPRDSRIPISVKQTPPSHSASQGSLAPAAATAMTPTSPTMPVSHASAGKADAPTRTKIPISKVPVRRTGNKPVNTRHAPSQAPHRK